MMPGNEEEKNAVFEVTREHILAAQNEHDLNNDCISHAMNGNDDGTPYHHLPFDYSQNVSSTPWLSDGVPLYFTTPRKVQIFGAGIDIFPNN